MTTASHIHRMLSRASGGSVSPGATISAQIDRTVISGARGPATLVQVRQHQGKIKHPDRVVLAMDFLAPEVESSVPRSRALCREVADASGLIHVFDLNMGIGSHVAIESGRVAPGHLVAGCGRCLGVVGGIGGFGVRFDEADLALALAQGEASVTVPQVHLITVHGRLPRWIGPWDMALAVRDLLGPQLQNSGVEFAGDANTWSVDFRIALCGFLTEMGAAGALVPADAVVAEFYSERGAGVELPEPASADAYASARVIEVGEMVSSLAKVSADPRGTFASVEGRPVHGAFVGSCYGGRYEDLARVAEVLKRVGRVAPGVRLAISPATLETARASLMAGFTEIFLQAGAMVGVPGGGAASTAGSAMFGEGETIASTAEYRRQLEPGQGEPEVWVMSPAAATVAAVTGSLTDPARFLS